MENGGAIAFSLRFPKLAPAYALTGLQTCSNRDTFSCYFPELDWRFAGANWSC